VDADSRLSPGSSLNSELVKTMRASFGEATDVVASGCAIFSDQHIKGMSAM
jgi:hypothetical protein